MTFKQTLLDPHTVHEVQMMVRDLLKDKVCELESQAAEVAEQMPAYSKQLLHAAREVDNMQLQTFLLLHDVWDASCESVLVEMKGRIDRPELPDLTPTVPCQVVTD